MTQWHGFCPVHEPSISYPTNECKRSINICIFCIRRGSFSVEAGSGPLDGVPARGEGRRRMALSDALRRWRARRRSSRAQRSRARARRPRCSSPRSARQYLDGSPADRLDRLPNRRERRIGAAHEHSHTRSPRDRLEREEPARRAADRAQRRERIGKQMIPVTPREISRRACCVAALDREPCALERVRGQWATVRVGQIAC